MAIFISPGAQWCLLHTNIGRTSLCSSGNSCYECLVLEQDPGYTISVCKVVIPRGLCLKSGMWGKSQHRPLSLQTKNVWLIKATPVKGVFFVENGEDKDFWTICAGRCENAVETLQSLGVPVIECLGPRKGLRAKVSPNQGNISKS